MLIMLPVGVHPVTVSTISSLIFLAFLVLMFAPSRHHKTTTSPEMN